MEYPIYVRAGSILPILDHQRKHYSLLNALGASKIKLQVYLEPRREQAEGYLILDDGMTTDTRKVKVNAFYEKKVFSIAVEAEEDGFNPDKVIDGVEIYGLSAIPTSVKFNETILGKYSAKYRVDFAKRSVEIEGLNLRITNQEVEKIDLFTLKLPT